MQNKFKPGDTIVWDDGYLIAKPVKSFYGSSWPIIIFTLLLVGIVYANTEVNVETKIYSAEPNEGWEDADGNWVPVEGTIKEKNISNINLLAKDAELPVYISLAKVENAIQEYKKYGILPSIKLGQAILETGHGKSVLAKKCNNHFGSKYYKSTYNKTKKNWHKFDEVVKGKYNLHDDDPDDLFYIFNGYWASSRYHTHNLLRYSRVQALLKSGNKDYKDWARAVKASGYATKKTYAEDLIKIIKDYKLDRWD